MKINNNNGHTISGNGSGAVGLLNESICTRQIGNHFVKGMKSLGHTVYDCTIEKSTNYLFEAVNLANKNKVDYAISHHLNHVNDSSANGVEVWVYDLKDKETVAMANKICIELSKLGFKNRGVKESKTFYWIRKTNSKAMIIEYLFCSNNKDVSLYNPEVLANAVIKALTNVTIGSSTPSGKITYVDGRYDCLAKVVNVGSSKLNVRKDRTTNSAVIWSIPKDTIIKVHDCKNNWFEICVHSDAGIETGYVFGEYIQLMK